MRTLAPSRMRKISRRRRGFTLIEVLLVLAILVILAGLSVVAIANVQGNANNRLAKGQIGSLQNTMDIYKLPIWPFARRRRIKKDESAANPPASERRNDALLPGRAVDRFRRTDCD